MADVSTYLNFPGTTEEAFVFYRSVFGGEFDAPGIRRMSDAPSMPGQPPLSEADRKLVLHVSLPILGGHRLMATDCGTSMGFNVVAGNNTHILLQPDTRAEADSLFNALSAGGKVEMPMQDMFWGDYFGSFADRFGINWMIACGSKA